MDGAASGWWLCKGGWVCARKKLRVLFHNVKYFMLILSIKRSTSFTLSFTGQLKNVFSFTTKQTL